MSNESEQKSLAITPKELQLKLNAVIMDVLEKAESGKPEDNWARQAVEAHAIFYKSRPNYFSDVGIVLPIKKIKVLCPELYDQLLKPAFEQVDNKLKPLDKFHKPIRQVNLEVSTAFSVLKDIDLISIGTSSFADHSLSELTQMIAHEYGHNYQTKPNSKIAKEHDADRHSPEPLHLISCFLNKIINLPARYDYDDIDSTHPNNRKRIKALLRQELSDNVFGMNGQWVGEYSDYSFVPNDKKSSPLAIKLKLRDEYGDASTLYPEQPITENGKVVTNWQELQTATEQKSEELMKKLDGMVASGLSTDKKEQWLEMIKSEIEKFKESNKPQFAPTPPVLTDIVEQSTQHQNPYHATKNANMGL